MDDKELNKRVRQVVRLLLGMPENSVRPANQNAPSGAIDEQYATVLLSTINPTGWDQTELENIDDSLNVNEQIKGQRLCVASVQFFRGDAYNKATRLQALLKSSKAAELMRARALGFVRTSSARNLTNVMDTLWEDRGQIDFEFHVIGLEQIELPTYGIFEISVDTAVQLSDGTFLPPQAFEVYEP